MSKTSNARSRGASLKSLISRARFIHADDVLVQRCRIRAEECQPGDLFVVNPLEDDHDGAAARAVARGVSGLVTERLLPFSTPQCLVPDAAWAYAHLCDALAGSPGKRLLTIGVVGKDGKTSAVVAIAAALREQGLRTAYHCDLGSSDGVIQGLPAARHSDAAQVTQWLESACDASASVAVIEISESMLSQQAALPVHPDLLVVTDGKSISMVKRAIEFLSDEGVIVANANCPRLERWLESSSHGVLRYGISTDVEVNGVIFKRELGEMTMLVTAGDVTAALQTKLGGRLLAHAQLAAVATGLLLGADLTTCLRGLQKLTRIPGRNHRLPAVSGPAVFLDVASSQSQLTASLKAIRGECHGVMHTIMMLPGDVKAEQRALLGTAMERHSKRFTVTAMPQARKHYLKDVHDVLDGMEHPERVAMVASWRQAIRDAMTKAKERDVIVVVCPQGDMAAEAHRELLEAIAECVQENSGPRILSHPSLLAAS